jgi:hypothetical protein
MRTFRARERRARPGRWTDSELSLDHEGNLGFCSGLLAHVHEQERARSELEALALARGHLERSLGTAARKLDALPGGGELRQRVAHLRLHLVARERALVL